MSSIAAGTTLSTGLVSTGDTSGELVLKTNGTTTALSIDAAQNVTIVGNLTAKGLTYPTTDGTNGQFLQTNGSGTLSFGTVNLATPFTVTGSSTAGAELRLPEDTDNGSNYVALKAADSIASNVTFTLPSADGTSGQVLQTNASGTLSFGNVGVANGGTGQTSLTANNVILGNGTSAVQFVAPGSSGNILTSNGTTWQSTAPAAGGSWVFLSSATASSSATISLETTFNSTYETYAVIGSNVVVENDNAGLGVLLKINGSYQTAGYKYNSTGGTSGSNTYVSYVSNSASSMVVLNDLENSASFANEFILYVNEPTNTARYKSIWGSGISWDQGNNQIQNQQFAGSYFNGVEAMTGIRFQCTSGNITSGTFRLYGIKKS